MKCSNCGTTLSCGCQKKRASNGVEVCANCIASYELSIKRPSAPRQEVARERQVTEPTVTGIDVRIN